MSIKYFTDVTQGSDEWYDARRGLLTASEMKLIITPAKLQYASNDKERAHVYEIAAQRISQHTEPSYVGDDMMRGVEDEYYARSYYENHYAPVKEVGFITNDKLGFAIGYSPDGLVGDDGLIEIKSRKQKFQVETILRDDAPDEYMLQIQTGLFISERAWCDFISYSNGLPMVTMRIYPDEIIQDAIAEAAKTFEQRVKEKIAAYHAKIATPGARFIPTERRIHEDIRL